MAGGFILCKFSYEKKISGLIQNKLPTIFITVLVLGIIILAACNRFANRKSFDRVITKKSLAAYDRLANRKSFDKVIAEKTPDIMFLSEKSILLKVALLYPIIIFFVCGFLGSSIFFMSTDKQVLNLLWQNKGPVENLEINALGRISSHVKNMNGTSFFSISIDKLQLKDLSFGREQTINVKDEVFVKIRTNDRYFLKRDDLISFNCSVSNNEGFMSLMAYQGNVIKIGSGSTGKINNYYTDDINNYDTNKTGSNTAGKANSIVGTHKLSDITQKIYNIRSKFYECIRNTFYNSLDYTAAALSEAIILGNTNNIPEKTLTDFRKSGIYHLIAISGLHITFFIYLATVLLNFILRPSTAAGKYIRILKLTSFIFIIMILFLYNFIAGEKASALRATVMSVFVLTANLMERQYNKKIILSISFILLLTLNPEFFYNWGFWLSFASMAGIIYLNPIITDLFRFIRKRLQKAGSYFFGSFPDTGDPDSGYKRSIRKSPRENYFISSIITTVSVNIFIFPVLIFLFKELPVFSIPANLLAAPVFYMLLAILLAASFLALLWPPFGGFIIKPAGLLVEVLLKIARIYKISDFNVISLSNLKPYHMVIYYFALAAVSIALSLWLNRKKSKAGNSLRI
jgi:ComEC/Rec2-related protein